MRTIVFLMSILALVSCGNSVEKNVRKFIELEHPNAKYELLDFSCDTINRGTLELFLIKIQGTKDSARVRMIRNSEFKGFGRPDDYYYQITEGELRDASPFCTELRLLVEMADSILSNWDSVPEYDYCIAYLNAWYADRLGKWFGNDSNELSVITPSERLFKYWRVVEKEDLLKTVGYMFEFRYSIGKTEYQSSVTTDTDFNILVKF